MTAAEQAGVSRDSRFAHLQPEDVAYFRQVDLALRNKKLTRRLSSRGLLGDSGVITDADELSPFNNDWMNKYHGKSQIALRPKTTEQVSEIIAHCSRRRLAVVPQGGNTGLVGGSVPVFDEVILSTSGMDSIRSLDQVSGILTCQAGCILQTLDDYLSDYGLMMPVSFGAKGSCHIGGMVSTNAGGVHFLRYGSLHGTVIGKLMFVLWLECYALVLDLLSTLRKDNTGYDLKQLFVGAEGTLGIVTAVSILAVPRPVSRELAFLACPTYDAVQATFVAARQHLGEVLSAYEFMDREALDLAVTHLDGVRDPLPETESPLYVLVESSGADEAGNMRARMERFLEAAMSEGHVVDGTIAQDDTKAGALWRMREELSVALVKAGAVYKYDLSLPIKDIYPCVEAIRERVGSEATVVSYGHLGDGNLHLNVSLPAYSDSVFARIEPFVFEWVAARRGSVSAEHGLGLMKAKAIHYSKPPQAVALMKHMKDMLDPHGLLNPYKVLPPS
eukprot:jgi/Chlat1/6404/Chrsp45S05914